MWVDTVLVLINSLKGVKIFPVEPQAAALCGYTPNSIMSVLGSVSGEAWRRNSRQNGKVAEERSEMFHFTWTIR